MEENTEEIFINLTIKLSGNTFKIKVDSKSSLEEFKDILSVKIAVPAENISLILNGRPLVHEELTLSELGVKDENTLYLTVSRKDYIPTSVPLEPIGSSPEEKMMEQMMDNPMYASMFNNPDLMKGIMESSPQLKKILDSNPELRHVMNDPAAMSEMMRTMRSPTLRREMMRNTDRMMSNIESMPGGFNELRKMYRSIQEPMENAMDEMQSEQPSQSSSSSSNSQNDGTANTSALPNPWATPSASSTSGNNTGMGNLFGNPGAGGMGNLFSNPNLMNSMMGGQNNNMFGGQNITEMMNNPAVQSILNNPEMMNQILSSISGGQGGANAGLPQNNLFGNSGLGQNNNNNMFRGMMNPAMMSQMFGGMNNNAGQTTATTPNTMSGPNNFGNPLMFNPALMNQLLGGINNNNNIINGSTNPSLANPNMFTPLFGLNRGNTSPSTTPTTQSSPLSNSSSLPQTQTTTTVDNNNNNNNNNNNITTNNNNNTPISIPTQPEANANSNATRYSIQITQLNEMGFSDNVKNLQALEQSQGNVERALELLFLA
jgi:ubiquilin